MEKREGVPELDTKGILINFSKYNHIISLIFFFKGETVVNQYKVFDGGKFDPASEVEGIRLEAFIPFGGLISKASEVNYKVYVMTGGWKWSSDYYYESL